MHGALNKHHRSVHALFDSTCDQEYGYVKIHVHSKRNQKKSLNPGQEMTQTQTQTLMLQEYLFGLNLTGYFSRTPAILDMRVFTCANTDQSSNHREHFTEVWPSSFPNNFNLYICLSRQRSSIPLSPIVPFILAPFRFYSPSYQHRSRKEMNCHQFREHFC